MITFLCIFKNFLNVFKLFLILNFLMIMYMIIQSVMFSVTARTIFELLPTIKKIY